MGMDTVIYVYNQLHPYIKKKSTIMRESISVEKRVTVNIWRLAANVEYRTIGHLFGISRASVCCIVQEVCREIVHVLMPKYIKWPEGDEIQDIVDFFEHKWGYPQCGGAIDGSHILIIAPQQFHIDFFNRRGWHSIILQGVVWMVNTASWTSQSDGQEVFMTLTYLLTRIYITWDRLVAFFPVLERCWRVLRFQSTLLVIQRIHC